MAYHLNDDVGVLNGIGPAKRKLLSENGIEKLSDLLKWYPRDYQDRSQIWRIRSAPLGEKVCVQAVVARRPVNSYIRKGMTLTKVMTFDDSASLSITFFNQPYTAKQLQEGETYTFYGQLDEKNGRRSMANPLFEKEGTGEITGHIVPIYPLRKGMSEKQLRKWIRQALEVCDEIVDGIPEAVRQSNALLPFGESIRTIHAPDSFEELTRARRRLAFEELFFLSVGLEMLQARRKEANGCLCAARKMEEFLATLPYELTDAQKRTIRECFEDLCSGRPMNRLVQGDVGSGKTIVAAGVAWLAIQSGWQVAMMAPTEILAKQHYKTMKSVLEPLGITVGIITGGMKSRDRNQVTAQLAAGEINFVVGTHALISNCVEYAKLGLVITDEQHRFGVNQRSAFSEKATSAGITPHVLVMSATPIPRTLALIIYGDLDLSIIDERPPGRKDVDTFLVGEDKRARMNGFIQKQVMEGHQVYIVCPAVEESESEGFGDLKNVTEFGRELQEQHFPKQRVGIIHGKMKPLEKEQVMNAFLQGEIDILVSTTVIEVGVDAPNATLMVIENAERFGLSQLHQLRGRVGRGEAKSYCVLMSNSRNDETKKRLKTLCATNDGFQIAEADLQMRGPGDFFGARQHGLPQLNVADLSADTEILYEAKTAAEQLVRVDPELASKENQMIYDRVRMLFEEHADSFN